MDDELKDAIAEVCAACAVNMYQATRISPARTQEEMNQAKINVKKHITVDDNGEHIAIKFNTMGLVREPPFYAMVPATIATSHYRKACDDFFAKSPVLSGRKFYYM